MAIGRVSKKAFHAGILAAMISVIGPQSVLAQPGGDGGPPGSTSSGTGTGTGSDSGTLPPPTSSSGTGSGGDSSSNSGPPQTSSDSGSGSGVPPDGAGGSTSSSSTSGVSCETSGVGADYSEVLSGTGSSTTRNTSTTSGCPNHVYYPLTPDGALETPFSALSAAYPMLMEGNTSLADAQSPTGMMLNGVALYSSFGRVTVEGYETSAFFIEGTTLDLCGGHPTPDGTYHYHSTPGCLQEHAMTVHGVTAEEHSPQLGWAYDGFPVYGQLGPDGIEMKMCGEEGADSTHCLDWCSGYEAEIDEDEFLYRYYLTCGADESFFPFTTNCYRGCCPDGMTCGGEHVETCGDDAVEGYTAAYTPVVASALTDTYDTVLLEGNDTDYAVMNGSAIDCSLYMGSWGDDSTVSPSLTPSIAPLSPSTTSSTTGDGTLAPSSPPTTSSITSDGTAAPASTDDATVAPAADAESTTPAPADASPTGSPASEIETESSAATRLGLGASAAGSSVVLAVSMTSLLMAVLRT